MARAARVVCSVFSIFYTETMGNKPENVTGFLGTKKAPFRNGTFPLLPVRVSVLGLILFTVILFCRLSIMPQTVRQEKKAKRLSGVAQRRLYGNGGQRDIDFYILILRMILIEKPSVRNADLNCSIYQADSKFYCG